MVADKAESFFHGQERYNCAQAVLRTFAGEFCISNEEIVAAAKKGAGRAEDGLCGALYAGRLLINDEAIKHQLNIAFEKEAGAIHCRKIRKINKLSCEKCVRLAAGKVEELLLKCV